jgi:hypothetical protein
MPEHHSSIAGGTVRSTILPVIRIYHFSSDRANMIAVMSLENPKRVALSVQSTSHPFAKTADVLLT